jgi:regulator of RNase E activity RraA
MPQLTPQEIEALRRLSTPTISNAIETFNIRPRNVGFMGPEIKCIFPEMGVIVGYASTAKISAKYPATRSTSRHGYWDHVVSIPAPRIAVIQDLDNPKAVGSLWGDVNGNTHKALGCLGCVTDGGVRDLDEVRAMGFQFYASAVIVSHAYVHIEEYGTPVEVGGVVVKPGDLIAADKHGVITIPFEIAREIPRAAAEVEARERKIISICQSPDFTLEKLKQASP